MVISRTPLRISFFGGGSDRKEWWSNNAEGGQVLAATIDKYVWVTARWLPPYFEHKSRIVYRDTELVICHDAIRHPSVRECLRFLNIERGVEIHYDGDVPGFSGLGSSSAFTVGLLTALIWLKNETIHWKTCAESAQIVEQSMIGECVGCQDQVMAAHGGLNRVRFAPDGSFSVEQVTLPVGAIDALNRRLLLYFVGLPREAQVVARTYSFEPRVVSKMTRMVDDGVRHLESGNLGAFGSLLNSAWKYKQLLSPEITNGRIDEIYDIARKNGAVGAKLCGAGSGGFMLFYCEPELQDKLRAVLSAWMEVPFAFEKDGAKIIFADT